MGTAPRAPIPTGAGRRTRPPIASWVFLSAFLLLTGLARGVYAASGQVPSGRFQLVTTIGFVVVLWQWFTRQVAAYRPDWSPDAGVFITAFWLIVMPYFFWRYERWRGLLKISAVAALYVASYGAALLVWWLLGDGAGAH